MNVLMVSDVYYPRINGVSTSMKTSKVTLEKQGCNVSVIAPEYPAEETDGTSIFRVKSRYLFIDPEDRLMRYRAALQLEEQIKALDIDIIHIHTPFIAHYVGVKLSKRLGIPVIATYHTYFEEYVQFYLKMLPPSITRNFSRTITRKQCNQLDGVIVPSNAMKDVLNRYGVRVDKEVIPTGVSHDDLPEGNGDRFREKYNITKDKTVLLYVGRVAYEKNINFLLNVMHIVSRKNDNCLMIIAGEGPAKESLVRRVNDLGLTDSVLFVGYLDRKSELGDCYCASDIFTFSSKTETQGLVLLEAQLLGLPLVSLSYMGAKDILDDNPGALVSPDNPLEFANRVLELVEDKEKRQVLANASLQYAQKWHDAELSKKLIEFYKHVIESQGEDVVETISAN